MTGDQCGGTGEIPKEPMSPNYFLKPFLLAASAGLAAASPPVAQPDEISMHRGQKARIAVLKNDANAQTLTITEAPAFGSAVVTTDQKILYSQTTGSPTSDTFVYQIQSSTGETATAAVTIGFAETLRVANPDLNVPTAPPATAISLVNALGSLKFSSPLCLRTPPGETKRLFVCEKGGVIRVVPDVTAGSPTASEVLDISGVVNSAPSECGLLSMAFHPQFATNRYFYVFYSHSIGGLHQRVSRFTMSSADPNVADDTSELILIDQADDASNHNGGDMHFGADGYLYISVGDEGNGNDTLMNSQRIDKDIFSAMLRIDVDKISPLQPNAHAAIPTDANGARFTVPTGNPFVLPADGGTWDGKYNGVTIADPTKVHREFYATGLRNPWRFSFDAATGELWCGDVGQGTREEVDIIENGGNYGWNFREGNIVRPGSGAAPPNFDTLYATGPIYDYDRSTPNFSGYSITGGLVYRGSRIGSLVGKYIFADYGSGHIWSLQRNGAGAPTVERIAGESGIAAFGTDPSNQDVLLANIGTGRIRRLVSTTAGGNFPATLSATGLFADLTDLSPAPGLLPYAVNLPFWSDHAEKSRWFIVPDGVSKFGWAKESPWTLPPGTIWVKHFDMVMNRNAPEGEPVVRKRIETRLIVENADGIYGVSYRWNEAGTEALLAEDAGEDFVLNVTDAGSPAAQTWHIPSRAECMTCHTPQGGQALSFNTRQLNLEQVILGFPGNQLDVLAENGFFAGVTPGSPNLLPRHLRPDETSFSVEGRVRSYLAVNCAYCHLDGGTAPTGWDGRAFLTLAETGLIDGAVTNDGGDSANRLVVPGSAAHSVVLQRVAAANGFTRMPPLGSNVIDAANVALLTEWITGELVNNPTYDVWRLGKFGSASSLEGEPGEDPDHDGLANRAEFLAGTSPRDGSSVFQPQVDLSEGNVKLGFSLPPNRSFTVWTSTNLSDWTAWDVPGNQGLPVAGGLSELTQPLTGDRRFFRVDVREN